MKTFEKRNIVEDGRCPNSYSRNFIIRVRAISRNSLSRVERYAAIYGAVDRNAPVLFLIDIAYQFANHTRDAFIRLQMNHTDDIIFPGMCIVIGYNVRRNKLNMPLETARACKYATTSRNDRSPYFS